MNCIIIEDQPPAQRLLKKYITDIGTLKLEGVFSDAIQALDYLKNHPVDLIFLDIHLPRMSGIDFLRTLPIAPRVILTTAFPDYALQSYEFDVVDYLLKPFSFQRFAKAVTKLEQKDQKTFGSRKVIFIKSGYEYIRINTDDIIYIRSDRDYTEVIVPGKKYLSSDSLRQWLVVLNHQSVVRVHKSYIVNVSKIDKVAGNEIFLAGEYTVPIGRAYKDEFVNKFIN